MSEPLSDRFAGHMGRLLGPNFPPTIGLAVSGGSDSMALLMLTYEWARIFGVRIEVATVDHRLRSGSAAEAAMVAAECEKMGIRHFTLHWRWDKKGNLQDAARRARQELVTEWRGENEHVLLGHTMNDQAETLVMRLARGSGVEGLSAMAAVRDMPGGWKMVRPLLTERRSELRHHLDVLQVPYAEDPSNEDDVFDRIRIRKALKAFGLDATGLAATAARMERAWEALAARAVDVAKRCLREEAWQGLPTGDLLIDRDAFAEVERDTQLRLLAAALRWVTSARYRPRAVALEGLLDRVLAGGGGTLHGAQVIVTKNTARVCREYAAVAGMTAQLNGVTTWDNRWRVAFQSQEGLTVRALGPDGWQQLSSRPADGVPHDAAITRPALFDGPRLVACDAMGGVPGFQATLEPLAGSFVALLESR